MRGNSWTRYLGLVVLATILLTRPSPAVADGPADDLALAERYAPVLYFHTDELFRPQPVEVMVEQARLRQARTAWFDVNVLNELSVSDLFFYHGAEYFLDAWYGDSGASDYKNYSAHRAHYAASLSPEAGGPPVTTYARVVRGDEHIVIQYWLFYFYNDWFNKHEGDWEMVQVVLDREERPLWVVLSQHHGGTRRPWSAVQVEDEAHSAAFVALGSHANYFWGDEVYPNVRSVGGEAFAVVDRTGRAGRVLPQVLLLPEREDVVADPAAWPGMEWLRFGGNWGERAAQADFGGPRGPADKAEQWARPYDWAVAQPADEEEWYHHRLRVTVEADEPVRVDLLGANGRPVPEVDRVEEPGGGRVTLLLHRDPDAAAEYGFSVSASQGARVRVNTAYPYREQGEVVRVAYDEVSLSSGEAVVGRLCASCLPGLERHGPDGGQAQEDTPAAVETSPAVWDAPDVVWLAGLLPAEQVIRGLGLALLAGLLPTFLYVAVLYWADRYEKEPKRLLAATFVWGAVPALLVALVVRLFFRLPPALLGPEAVEAVGAGLVAPLAEELLKGAVVLFIYVRYRREFDGLLDGVVYGGMVGFGFAMTGNTVSYLGAFLLHGWTGLSATVYVEGLLYGLNHALYTAVFGAGLGLARTMKAGQARWLAGLGGFVLAVLAHGLHNLAVRQALGLSLGVILATWAGLLAMAGLVVWALVRERRILVVELAGEVSEELHREVTLPGGRSRARWQALFREGVRGLRRVRRLHQLCAELAFKKWRAARHPEEADLAAEVERLKAELRTGG
jgi:RsiW-degrading membrane proteinase PrsW (M82 family)